MLVIHLNFNMKSKKKEDSKKKKSKAKPEAEEKAPEADDNTISFAPKIDKCGIFLKEAL